LTVISRHFAPFAQQTPKAFARSFFLFFPLFFFSLSSRKYRRRISTRPTAPRGTAAQGKGITYIVNVRRYDGRQAIYYFSRQ